MMNASTTVRIPAELLTAGIADFTGGRNAQCTGAAVAAASFSAQVSSEPPHRSIEQSRAICSSRQLGRLSGRHHVVRDLLIKQALA